MTSNCVEPPEGALTRFASPSLGETGVRQGSALDPVLRVQEARRLASTRPPRGVASLRAKLAIQQVGLTMLILLMGLAFWNDLSRLWARFVGSL